MYNGLEVRTSVLLWSDPITATPEPKVSTSFKIPKTLLKRLQFAKVAEERDMGDIVADALEAYFEKHPSDRKK